MKNQRRIGAVVVAGQPTDEELREAAAAGFTTVVNVRMPDELDEPEEPKVRAAGLDYASIPYTGATIAREHIERLRDVLAAGGTTLVH